MIEGFLTGVIATSSLAAGFFFLKFWRATRDSFFLIFAIAFIVEGLNRCGVLILNRPNEGSVWTYTIRLISFLLILWAILRKNFGRA